MSTETLQQAVEYMVNNNTVKFQETVTNILAQKINDAIDAHKEVVASTMFMDDEE